MQDRLQNIIVTLTTLVHRSVSRGLFDRHRLPFTTLIAAGVASADPAAPPSDSNSLRHILRPPPSPNAQAGARPGSGDSTSIAEEAGLLAPLNDDDAQSLRHAWPQLQALARAVPACKELVDSASQGVHMWRAYAGPPTAAMWETEAPAPEMLEEASGGGRSMARPYHITGSARLGVVDKLALTACWHHQRMQPLLTVRSRCEFAACPCIRVRLRPAM